MVPEEPVASTRALAGASSVPPGMATSRTAPAPSRKGTASGTVRVEVRVYRCPAPRRSPSPLAAATSIAAVMAWVASVPTS